MTDWQKEKVKEIAYHYGATSQKEKTVEECAELILAIKKHDAVNEASGQGIMKSLCDIASEIADVMIMCEQLSYLYGIEEIVKEQIDFKISRQLDRMEKGE